MDRAQMFSRQADFIPDLSNVTAAILGVGGLGSNVARTLAAIGVQNLILIDPDVVAVENVAPGCFSLEDVDEMEPRLKVDVVGERLKRWYRHVNVTRVPDDVEKVDLNMLPGFDIGLALTDTIASRRAFWEMTGESVIQEPALWVDARMGDDGYDVITFRLDDETAVARYNKHEIQQKEIPLPCGRRGTAFVTQGIVPYLVGATVTNWQKGDRLPYVYRGEATRPGDIMWAGAAM